MYIEIFKYIEGDDSCETGEYLGYVSLEEDDIYIDIDNDMLAEKIEDIFSEPITTSSNPLGPEKEVEPYTEDFFRHVTIMLPDLNVRGRLKEDEGAEAYLRRNPVDPENDMDDDDLDELPMEIPVENIRSIEPGYEIDEEADEVIAGELTGEDEELDLARDLFADEEEEFDDAERNEEDY